MSPADLKRAGEFLAGLNELVGRTGMRVVATSDAELRLGDVESGHGPFTLRFSTDQGHPGLYEAEVP